MSDVLHVFVWGVLALAAIYACTCIVAPKRVLSLFAIVLSRAPALDNIVGEYFRASTRWSVWILRLTGVAFVVASVALLVKVLALHAH
jgi:hypothetical protein